MKVNLHNQLEFLVDYRLYKAQINFDKFADEAVKSFLKAQNPDAKKKRKKKAA